MQALIDLYLKPLRDMVKNDPKTAILTENEVKTVFPYLEPIYGCNSILLQKLTVETKEYDYFKTKLGPVFSELAVFLKTYTLFVNGYPNANTTLNQAMINKPNFVKFIEEARKDTRCKGLPLKDLLIMPVQRVNNFFFFSDFLFLF